MIYLDHAATTDLLPAARETLIEWSDRTGNASGSHAAARAARRAVEDARDSVASLLGCSPHRVVFCSGGTEADAMVVAGATGHGTVLCSAVEHPAVLEPTLHRGGVTVAVDGHGRLDLDALAATLAGTSGEHGCALVSIMAANNEVGTVEPVLEAAAIVRRLAPTTLVHCDAVQAGAWIDLAPIVAAVDSVAISAHKFGGPQGVGALAITGDASARVSPRQLGGGQEQGRRSGSHHVAGIAAMGAAARQVQRERVARAAGVATIRDRLVDRLASGLTGVTETVPRHLRLPNNAHVCIDGVHSEVLLFALDRAGVAASAASSCASGAQQGSHVLAAMGVDPSSAAGALRLTTGWSTTESEVDAAAEIIVRTVSELRERAAASIGHRAGSGGPPR